MLTKIAARSFKAVGESPGLDLSLSGLNLFLGQNNSGKTSAVDVVGIFAQTARDRSGISGLKWSGELIDLGLSGEYAVHNGNRSKLVEIMLEIKAPADFMESFRQQLGTAWDRSTAAQTIGYRVTSGPSISSYRYEFLIDGLVLVRNLNRQFPRGGNRQELEVRDFHDSEMEFLAPTSTGGSIFDTALFGTTNLRTDTEAHKHPLAFLLMAQTGLQIIRKTLAEKIFLLGASRGLQKGSLDDKFETPDVGRNGQHTLQVLSSVFAKPEHRKAADKIREWSQVFGLSDVSSGWAGGSELHAGYMDSLTSTPLPLRSAGFGSQQILPIIVQLFASPEDSFVAIEEPEISLHPAAQVRLVQMFAEAMRAGRQLVITTHSQYLVMAIQEIVNRELRPSDINVYHFSRARNDVTAERLPIGSDGVLQGWIPSFAEVERELLTSWMSKVHDKLKNE